MHMYQWMCINNLSFFLENHGTIWENLLTALQTKKSTCDHNWQSFKIQTKCLYTRMAVTVESTFHEINQLIDQSSYAHLKFNWKFHLGKWHVTLPLNVRPKISSFFWVNIERIRQNEWQKQARSENMAIENKWICFERKIQIFATFDSFDLFQ